MDKTDLCTISRNIVTRTRSPTKMRTFASSNMLFLVCLFLLLGRTESLNMTVQVTVSPIFGFNLPICSYPFLQAFQSNLTAWVLQATTPTIPDFTLEGGLVLVFRAPAFRRRLRSVAVVTSKSSSTSVSSLKSSAICTSAGCMVNWVNGRCNMCGASRRLATNETSYNNTIDNSTAVDDLDSTRELYNVDFNLLGSTASNYLQNAAQLYLWSHLGNAGGCLGFPTLLSVQVQYLVNQTFNPSLFQSLQQLLDSLL